MMASYADFNSSPERRFAPFPGDDAGGPAALASPERRFAPFPRGECSWRPGGTQRAFRIGKETVAEQACGIPSSTQSCGDGQRSDNSRARNRVRSTRHRRVTGPAPRNLIKRLPASAKAERPGSQHRNTRARAATLSSNPRARATQSGG
jgi:hypothetical protein